jgi:hypothetical protein
MSRQSTGQGECPDLSLSMRSVAKMALLAAFASGTEAFQPTVLRSLTPATKAASTASSMQQVPIFSLRQGRNEKPAFLQSLRAAASASSTVDPVCREKMYDTAQAS